MWLSTSSIGRKVTMSLTGIALVLFLTFHACMNVAAVFSKHAYNGICEFLGSNWYAVLGTVVLVALMVLHFVFAIILTLQNRKARGNNRYDIVKKPDMVEWSSQNMLVLGFIVVVGLFLHFYNFWFNMMGAEFYNGGMACLPVSLEATDGVGIIEYTFHGAGVASVVYTVLYLLWFYALWLHLTHGMWSAMQTLGLNSRNWFDRWRIIGNVWSTIVILMFAFVAVYFALGFTPIYG